MKENGKYARVFLVYQKYADTQAHIQKNSNKDQRSKIYT